MRDMRSLTCGETMCMRFSPSIRRIPSCARIPNAEPTSFGASVSAWASSGRLSPLQSGGRGCRCSAASAIAVREGGEDKKVSIRSSAVPSLAAA